jgi:hypothetical protein
MHCAAVRASVLGVSEGAKRIAKLNVAPLCSA